MSDTEPESVESEESAGVGHDHPRFGTALRRGLGLKCPICGDGKLFRDFLRMHERCEQCGFKFERAPGYFLGSTYINYAITAGATTFSYVMLHLVLRIPNSALLPGLVTFCAIFPLVFFRYARSLWLSIDCFLDREGVDRAGK